MLRRCVADMPHQPSPILEIPASNSSTFPLTEPDRISETPQMNPGKLYSPSNIQNKLHIIKLP